MFHIIIIVIAIAVALFYVFCDANYFLRMFFTVVVARLFQKKSGIKEVTSIYGICTTQDVDFFLNHMNNARYIRELDFARVHFYDRTGLYARIKAVGGTVLQGATSIRYRRSISIFSAYRIETKLVYWKDKNLYIEHKFVTLDGFVRAVVLSRQDLVNVEVDTLLKNTMCAEEKPDCAEEVELWIQALESSSAKLRKRV